MDDKIIPFERPGIDISRKKIDWSSERAKCKHSKIEVYPNEPIIECSKCGAIIDPYVWLRSTMGQWEEWYNNWKYRVDELKAQEDTLKKSIKWLRGEYADEREKREMERAVMVLPPHVRNPRGRQ